MDQKTPTKRKLYQNIILLLVSVCMMIGVLEIYCRYTERYITYNEKNGGSFSSLFTSHEKGWLHIYEPHSMRTDGGEEFSYSFKANNEGLLEKEFSPIKDSNDFRIMAIGDSFIQGIGVPYDSSCTKQLAYILNEHGNNHEFEVLNCGVGGSDPFFEYILLKTRLLKYNPDYIILSINSTDINDVVIRGGHERFQSDSTTRYNKAPWYEPIYAHSYLFRTLIHDVLKYDWLFMKKEERELAHANSIKLIQTCITDFQKLCQANDIPLLVVFHPLNPEYSLTSEYQIKPLIKYCESQQIQHVDVMDCIKQQDNANKNPQLIYWPIDGHFNAKGYSYFAQCISKPVIEYVENK